MTASAAGEAATGSSAAEPAPTDRRQQNAMPALTPEASNKDIEEAALQYMEAVMGRKAGRAFMDEGGEEDEAKKAEAELHAAMAFLEDLWVLEKEEPPIQGTMRSSRYIADGRRFVPYNELAASMAAKDIVNTTRTPASQAAFAETLATHVQMKVLDDAVRHSSAAFSAAQHECQAASDELTELRQKIGSLKQERDELEVAKPPAPARLQQVRKWLAEKESALLAQEAILQESQQAVLLAETKVRAAELERDTYAPIREQVDEVLEADRLEQFERARAVADKETRAVKGYKVLHRRKNKEAGAELQRQEEQKQAQLEAARKGRALVRSRLREAQTRMQGDIARVHQGSEAQWQQRAKAVMDLKRSIQEINAETAARVSLYRDKLKAKKEQHERDFNDLLEAGLNPYEVARRKDVEASVRRQQKRIANKTSTGAETITKQLLREEHIYRAELKQKAKDRAYEEVFQKEMGVETREKKVEAYMRKVTAAKVDMLDPTSRLPVPPSVATVSKSWAFGLGGTRTDVLQKVASKHLQDNIQDIDLIVPRSMRRLMPDALTRVTTKV